MAWLCNAIKPFFYLISSGGIVIITATASSISASAAAVKIRHLHIRRSVQLKSVYQDIDDAPETDHHEQADNAVNHHIFAFLAAFLIVSAGYIFKYAVEKKHHRQSD